MKSCSPWFWLLWGSFGTYHGGRIDVRSCTILTVRRESKQGLHETLACTHQLLKLITPVQIRASSQSICPGRLRGTHRLEGTQLHPRWLSERLFAVSCPWRNGALNPSGVGISSCCSQFGAGFSPSPSFWNPTLLLFAREDAGGGGFAFRGAPMVLCQCQGVRAHLKDIKPCCLHGASWQVSDNFSILLMTGVSPAASVKQTVYARLHLQAASKSAGCSLGIFWL